MIKTTHVCLFKGVICVVNHSEESAPGSAHASHLRRPAGHWNACWPNESNWGWNSWSRHVIGVCLEPFFGQAYKSLGGHMSTVTMSIMIPGPEVSSSSWAAQPSLAPFVRHEVGGQCGGVVSPNLIRLTVKPVHLHIKGIINTLQTGKHIMPGSESHSTPPTTPSPTHKPTCTSWVHKNPVSGPKDKPTTTALRYWRAPFARAPQASNLHAAERVATLHSSLPPDKNRFRWRLVCSSLGAANRNSTHRLVRLVGGGWMIPLPLGVKLWALH